MTNRLRFLIMLFLFLFLPVDPGAAQTNSGGDTQAQSASGPNESGRGAGTASSDLFTGTASAGIPIDVPPGRNGLQPTLALTYRSSNGISWVGKGWELELGAIERSTKRGVDYAADDYVVRLGGSTVDLVYIGNDAVGNREYRAKIEGGFTRFKKMTATGNPYWEVTDKTGKRYLFGQTVVSQTAVSRQDDPANNTADPNYRIFKWCLERVEDPDGNYMLFSYSKDQGQIYLDHIDYTGNGAMLPINSVKFYLESRSNMPSMYTLNFRVRTSYRLKTIDVLANGSRVRAYQLTYTANASAARSLLSSVRSFDSGANIDPNYTVTGNALPASTLTYSPESASFDQTPQNWLTFGNGDPARYKFPDLNGDGLPDVAWIGCTPSEVRVALSTGGGFKTPTSWLSNYGNCGATRYPFADFNGDGKADVVYIAANPTVFEVGFSNGTTDFGTPIPRLENFGDGDPDRYRFIDLNGDGKADVAWIGCTPSEVRVALSNGPGFNVAPVPWVSNFGNCEPGRYQFSDFNGDGKADVVYIAASPTVLQVGLSNGTTKFDTPIPVLLNFGNADPSRYRFVDMNGDGKTDIAYIACSPTQISGAFSTTGTNFTTPTIWLGNVGNCDPSRYPFVDFNGDGKVDVAYLDGSGAISVGFSMGTGFNTPTPWSTYGNADPSRYPFADYSGDGKTDLLYIDGVGGLQVAPVMGPPDNLLVQISNGLGGTSTIAYTPSTRYTNPCLPFPVQTVSAVTSNDGSGVTSTTSYSYEGGCYSIAERDFRGFNHATVTGPAGPNGERTITETWFHQGNETDVGANNPLSATGYMKGKPYQVKVTNQQGLKYSDITTRYAQDTTSPYFNPPFLVDAETCEGGASCKHAQMAYGNLDTGATYYDANGNLTREDHYGDVDDPNDNKTVARSFITNSDLWIMGLPATETIYSGIGTTTRLAETRFYYDGAPDLSTQPTEGHLTRLERWLNTPDSYLATTMTYDGYGNLLSTTDPRGATSAICYDAGAIFPQKATNALGHIARTDYYGVSWNPACGTAPTPYTGSGLWGQVKSVTDANGQRSTTTYDTFGRPSQTTSPEGLITTTTYLNLGNPQLQRTRTVTVDGSADGLWSERYFDGMGRTYKSLAKGPNGTPVRQDTTYNTRGLVEKQSAPYFDPGETRRDATMTYDAMGRLIQTTAYDGTVATTSYGVWNVTAIDPNGRQHKSFSDVAGRLVRVEEYTDSLTTPYATTSYQYDLLGNLLKVTDTQGHLTTVAYDSLSRKIGMSDPDMGNCGDVTTMTLVAFPWAAQPCWNYDYDANGNLWHQQDGLGQTTTFTYDALNRVTLKQLADGTSVTYLYDTAPNGIGRLASVTDSSGGTSFQYDIMGRVTQSTKTVTSDPNAAQFPSGYTTLTQYDTLGRITTLTYPSPTAPAPQVTYSYNAAGGLYQITEGSTIYATYPADQYTALGQPKSVTYGNGVTTNYTYRSDNNRLQQIVTQLGTNPAYQDLAYTFDPVGNITRVLATTSAFGTEDRAFAYDGLHRLTQATYRPITPAGSATTYAYGYDTIGNLTNKSQGASTRKEETDVAITYQNPAAPPVTVENTSPAISYEKRIVNWSTQSQGNASGGSYAYSNAVGDTASVVFTGTGVQWISAKSKDSGIAQVYLDGVLQGSVDLYQQGGTLGQNNASYQQVVWSATGLTNTTHLVDVIVTGTKNSSSSNTYIAVDAFVVGTTTLQESSPAVTLTAHLDNTWTTKTNSAASGGSYAATDNQDAVVSYRFAGTGIQWLSVTSSDGKPIDVYLDGVYQATVNLYGATQYQQVVWSRTGLTSGLHLFKLARTPSQGGGGGGGCGGGGTCDQFTLDAVKVQATPDSAWVLTENSALTLDYGKLNSNNTGWSKQNDSAASGGSYQRASTSCGQCSADGMEATYSFSGYGIVWIARKDSVAGKADVWLDGVFQTTIDLYNATTLSQQQVWSRTDLSNGSHTLTIVVTGTKNASSGGTNVYLDALWVYNALGWHAVSDASASGGQTYATDQATATATVTFTGTGVSWLAPVGPTGGSATVVLDGNTLESVTVNLNHPLVRAQQIVYSKSGLTNGPHQLVITTTSSGTINSPVGGLIDALDVVGALTEQVACAYTNTAHVHAVSGCGGEQFAYGLTGNLTAYDHPTDNTKDQSYGWDVQNRLLSSTVNSVTTTFIYDGDGGRVKKIVSGAATVYIGQLYECTQTGGCTRYIFAGDDRIALRTSAGDFKYYHTDHLGSSTIITKGGDPNNPNDPDRGALDQAITYAPYGAIRTNSLDPASGVHHKFTGQERDDSTGLDFYSARYYASAMHRFISPDSIVPNFADPQSLNRYSYVRNNPILYTDPSGHIFGIDDVLTLGLSNLILAGAAVSMATAAATGATSHDELRQAAIAGGVSGPITIPASLFSLTLGCVPCAIAINTLAGAAGGAASSAAIGVDPGIGAAAGAVSGFVSSSVGAAVGPAGLGWNIYAAGLAQVGAAAATGGATSAALGGDFWQGAAQGAVGSAIVWGVTSSPQIVADFKSLLAWFASPSTAPPTVPSAALAPSYDPGRLAPGTTVTPVMGPAIRLGVWLVERALGARIGTLTIEDLVASGRVIEATKTLIQIDRSGGPAAANRAFDALAKGRQITNYGNGIRSVELPGGGSASVRPFSSAPSRPTIQIDQPTGPTIKIRF